MINDDVVVSVYKLYTGDIKKYGRLAVAYEFHTLIDRLQKNGIKVEYFAKRGVKGVIAFTPRLYRYAEGLQIGLIGEFWEINDLRHQLGNVRKADRYMLKVNRKDGLSQQAKDAYTAIFEARKAA